MAQLLPTKSLTTFLSLNALQCDQLARLINESIAYQQGVTDSFDSTSEAIKLCEQTLNILNTIQIQIKNKNLCKPNTKMKLPIKPNRLPDLPCDVLFSMCDYLDSFSKAHLRFTSMTTHIDMMGCSLDLAEIRKKYTASSALSPRDLIPLVKVCAPMRIIKRQPRNLCGCDASRQLQLIDSRTVEVNQTLCSDLTESQLSLLGIRRSWSITGIKVEGHNTIDDFMEMCNILNRHNAYRSVKRFEFMFSEKRIDILNTCGMTGYIKDLIIISAGRTSSLSLDELLPTFKTLRCINIQGLSINASLNDFVKYSPQIEELELLRTHITGDISCLAQLKNIKKLLFFPDDRYKEQEKCIFGDIASLSSCTKLRELCIKESRHITGNISALSTLTNLKVLTLRDTKVDGKIDSILKYLPKLNTLNLANKGLTGNIVLTGNVELETLDVDDNDMHLELSSLIRLKKLKECLICRMPNVKGDISVMCGLTNLKRIRIGSCPQVKGSINSLVTLPNLRKLILGFLSNITGDASLFSGVDIFSMISGCENIEGSD